MSGWNTWNVEGLRLPQEEGALSRMSRIKRMQSQDDEDKLRRMQISEMQRQQQEAADTRQAYAGAVTQPKYQDPGTSGGILGRLSSMANGAPMGPPQLDREKLLAGLMQKNPMQAMQQQSQFQQQDLAAQQHKLEFDKMIREGNIQNLELAGKRLEMTGRMLGTVLSSPPEQQPHIYAALRAQAIQQGFASAEMIPEQFDPNWVNAKRMEGLSLEKQIAQAMEEKKFAEAQQHNRATETTATANLKVAQGQLGLGYGRLNEEKRHNAVGESAAKVAAKTASAEQQRLTATAQDGLDAVATIEKELGDHGRLKQFSSAVIPGSPGARTLNTAIADAADVIARMRTGAAINASEEALYRSFLPGLNDSAETATYKLGRLKTLFGKLAAKQSAGSGGSGDVEFVRDAKGNLVRK